jgi:hypothetical protein
MSAARWIASSGSLVSPFLKSPYEPGLHCLRSQQQLWLKRFPFIDSMVRLYEISLSATIHEPRPILASTLIPAIKLSLIWAIGSD